MPRRHPMIPINHDLAIRHNRFTKSCLKPAFVLADGHKANGESGLPSVSGEFPQVQSQRRASVGMSEKADRLRLDYKRRQSSVNRPCLLGPESVSWESRNFAGAAGADLIRTPRSRKASESVYFSIRESWMVSSGACSTKCQEISVAAIRRNLFLNADGLVPESTGIGPRLGKVLSQY